MSVWWQCRVSSEEILGVSVGTQEPWNRSKTKLVELNADMHGSILMYGETHPKMLRKNNIITFWMGSILHLQRCSQFPMMSSFQRQGSCGFSISHSVGKLLRHIFIVYSMKTDPKKHMKRWLHHICVVSKIPKTWNSKERTFNFWLLTFWSEGTSVFDVLINAQWNWIDLPI